MTVMIDWVSARVPLAYDGVVNGGEVVSLDADGAVEWRSSRRLPVEGSFSSRVSVRGSFGELEFSGNPAKFLQGHNVFGSDDLVLLMARALPVVAARLGLPPSLADLELWRSGDYSLSRVDVARMTPCDAPERVTKVLDVLGQVARTKYQSRSVVGSGTVYIGQKSRRQTLKFYDKWAELQVRGHGLCAKLAPEWHQPLLDFAAGQVRGELTVRSRELTDRGLRRAGAWTPRMAELVYDARLEALEVSETLRLTEDVVTDLPPKLVAVYDAWRAGRDLRALYSRAYFYRLRRQLLDLAGIDIGRVQPRVVVTETEYIGGFPIGPLLRGPGSPIPDWARGTELLVS